MLRTIDRYIIKKFLGTFFFIMALLMAISIVFDVSEKIEEFIENDAPLKAILLDYYVNFVVHYSNMFSFLLVFIAVIFFTSKMAQRTEIIAILSSGVSFLRLMWPYFISATILVFLSLLMNHYIVPRSNEVRLDFEHTYVKNPYRIDAEDIHLEIAPGEIIYFEDFHSQRQRGSHFSVERWKDDGRLDKKLFATKAEWDSSTGRWTLHNVLIRDFRKEGTLINEVDEIDTTLGFKPKDMGQRLTLASAMTYTELDKAIQEELAKGSEDVVHYQLEKYRRTASPMATYVLTLIGLSIGSRKVRGGMGLHIAVGFFLALFYIFSMKVSKVAATNAGVDPLIAVWVPNFIFLGVAIVIYRLSPK